MYIPLTHLSSPPLTQKQSQTQGLEIRTDEYSDGSLMDEVMQLMLQAHDWDVAASGGREDPDVQVRFRLGKAREGTCTDHSIGTDLPSNNDSPIHPNPNQVVLGVLYNVSHDYDAAATAFRKALDRRPDDYSLWNKVRK